jgi:hypothetical protein
MARDARDQEMAQKCQEEEWEVAKLEQLKRVESNRQTEDEQWYSDELMRIEKETKERKSELERLRLASHELEEANRLKKAEEEEIALLKRALASKEDNQRSNRGRSRETKSSIHEIEVDEEENEDWDVNLNVEEASEEEGEEEEQPVRRNSSNASGSPRRRLIAVEDSTDDDEDLGSLMSSRLRTAHRKLSSASLPGEDLHSVRSAKARMARRNLSSTSLHRDQEMEDDCYTDEEDIYARSPSRKTPKVKRRPKTSPGTPHNVDDLMAQLQGFTPMGTSPHRSGSNSRSSSPMYMPGIHSNPYMPAYGASFSPPIGPYGYGIGIPGSMVNSGVGNITNSTISNVGNDNSVKKVYRPPSQRRR